jgi:hypothetical protein
MARFYGTMEGAAKTPVSRIGHVSSGVRAHLRGWDVGIQIDVGPDIHDRDQASIFLTKGSNNPSERPLATVRRTEEGFIVHIMRPDGRAEELHYEK